MFFYRAWAGNEGRYPQNALYGPEIFVSQFAQHRWGYAALLILTMLATVILNSFFIASFFVNSAKQTKIPHLAFLFLSIRDLLVGLLLIPICLHWFIINLGFFEGDEILCRFTAFADFFLSASYPFILISLAIILYTRKYPKLEDRNYGLPMDNLDPIERIPIAGSNPSSGYPGYPPYRPPSQSTSIRGVQSLHMSRPESVLQGHSNGHSSRQGPNRPPSVASSSLSYNRNQRPPSVASSMAQQSRRPPSVVSGSDMGHRKPQGNTGFQPKRPVLLNNSMSNPVTVNRPGSVTSSLASGRRVTQLQQRQPGFITSSPLREEEEPQDIWEELSMEYPGNNSPSGWDYLNQDESDPHMYDEPRFHNWHYWLLFLTWGLALAVGVPASMFVEYRPVIMSNTAKGMMKARPGCFIPAEPFNNPYGYTIDDPGFNFTLACLVITYILPLVLLVALTIMICSCKITDNSKFRRYVKILAFLSFVFAVSRSPMDILQLKGIVEAVMGFKQLSVLPYQLEYEIMLTWSTYLPLLANPVIYFCFCSEYRKGGVRGIRSLCGCPLPPEDEQVPGLDNYKEAEIMSGRSSISRTQKSNIL